ncbi:cupin domain-containing protein [Nocardia sp. CA-119907]|uniref:cupin domain-containing protein n=1 Tax=Nocardia sp. CA-119907 TaxID=3239973 RepID=UPI003D960106
MPAPAGRWAPGVRTGRRRAFPKPGSRHSIVLEGEIGFRSDDDEVVLEPGGYLTKPRGQMHVMWNAGSVPGRIVEIITPGGFETYFRELV